MDQVFDNIYIETSPVYELLSAMLRIQNVEDFIPDEKSKKYLPKDIINWLEFTRSKLSKETLKEFEVFFNIESFLGLGLIPPIYKNQKHKNIEDFLDYLKNISSSELVLSFFANGFKKDDVDSEYLQNIDTIEKAMNFIDHLNVPEQDKWNLLYFYKNPDEAKDRLYKLIKNFYYNHFKDKVHDISTMYIEFLEYFKDEISIDGYNKVEKILTYNISNLRNTDKFIFIPTYFHGTGLTTSLFQNKMLILVGMNRLNNVLTEEKQIDTLEALKAISDEKRIKIIQLLNERTRYGYEIGKELGLSNSTISHHLSILVNLKVIKQIRLENKIYYEVDKSQIEKILNKVLDLLT